LEIIDHQRVSSEDTVIGAGGALSTTLAFEANSTSSFRKSKLNDTRTNFDEIIETATSFEGISVSLYKSRETGLKVLLANVEVPIVTPCI
jgi:hypothetical protein